MAYFLSAGQQTTARPGGTNGPIWLAPIFVLHDQAIPNWPSSLEHLACLQAQTARVHHGMKPHEPASPYRMPRPLEQKPSQQGPACMLVSVSTTTSPVLRKQTSPRTAETRPAHLLNGHSHPVTLPPATPGFSAPLPSNPPKRARSPCFPAPGHT